MNISHSLPFMIRRRRVCGSRRGRRFRHKSMNAIDDWREDVARIEGILKGK